MVFVARRDGKMRNTQNKEEIMVVVGCETKRAMARRSLQKQKDTLPSGLRAFCCFRRPTVLARFFLSDESLFFSSSLPLSRVPAVLA